MSESLIDLWGVDCSEWVFEELNEKSSPEFVSEVDGEHIIGRIVGPMFCPNGRSENGRFYETALWEDVLGRPDIKNRLAARTMFGMIGHEEKAVDEKDLEQGRVSHFMNRLWIENRKDPTSGDPKAVGMGEAYVLGTPAGKNLRTYMKAKCKLKSSSRANGRFKPGGRQVEGLPVVDRKSYILETFDFVLRPGFPQVDPKLTEAQENPSNTMSAENKDMQVLMIESRDALQRDFVKVSNENRLLTEELTTLKGKALSEKHTKLLAKMEEAEATPENIAKLTAVMKELGLGDFDELVDFVSKIGSATASLIDGSPDAATTDAATESLKSYRALGGTPEEIAATCEEADRIINAYRTIGSPKAITHEMKRANECLRGYLKMGPLAKVQKIVESYTAMRESIQKKKNEDKALELSKEYQVPISTVAEMLESMPEEKVTSALASMVESRPINSRTLPTTPKGGAPMSENRATTFFRSISPPEAPVKR